MFRRMDETRVAATDNQRQKDNLPPFSDWLNGWFMFYVRRYFRRHFHALRLLAARLPAAYVTGAGG